MPLVPLTLPPGIWRNGTQYQAASRWYDANLVRWVNGVMRPMGGWRARTESAFTGKARGIVVWRDNSNTRRIAVGTSSKLYYINESAVITDITPASFTAGVDDATANTGYGAYTYGYGAYGTARPDTGSVTQPTTWSLDTWGELLVACSSADGKLLEWDNNVGNDAVAITNAPTSCLGLVVTADRILMALGAGGNPRKVQWSDQENNTTWTTSTTNRAGSWNLQTAGKIQTAKRVRNGTLILTDVDAHLATYVNYPAVYGFEQVGSSCGAASPNACVVFDGLAFWMGRDAFYKYDGTVVKLPSEVQDYVFTNLNHGQRAKIYAFANSVGSELWWLYPSAGSVEVDRYVAFNFVENHWTIGAISRTCGIDRSAYAYPMMVGADGILYDHEFGYSYDGASPYAESGPFEIALGDRIMHARKLIPDEKTTADCSVLFKTRYYPNSTESTTGAYTLASPTSVRFSGRQASLYVSGVRPVDWRWGAPRLEVTAGGLR